MITPKHQLLTLIFACLCLNNHNNNIGVIVKFVIMTSLTYNVILLILLHMPLKHNFTIDYPKVL